MSGAAPTVTSLVSQAKVLLEQAENQLTTTQSGLDAEAARGGRPSSKRMRRSPDEDEDACVPVAWSKNILRVLFTEERIQQRIAELGATISKDYADKENVVVVGMLTGAIFFLTDLVKRITVPNLIDFMAVSSYAGTQSAGTVQLRKDLTIDPTGKHILIVEDIIDTGTTLAWIRSFLAGKSAASVKVAVLLDKKEGRSSDHQGVVVDYTGFVCPHEFVVGYGLDFNQEYRSMPYIGVLKPEAYQ